MYFFLACGFLLLPSPLARAPSRAFEGMLVSWMPSPSRLAPCLVVIALALLVLAKVAQWFAADSDLRVNPKMLQAR